MIEPNLPGLSVGRQCALLSMSRSSFYYEPKGESAMNLDLMRVITARQAMLASLSIRIGQARVSVHFRPSRSKAFAMTTSLRMTAVIASFLHFPLAISS